MKRSVILALAFLASLAALPTRAETGRDSLEVLRTQLLADRKAVVAANLGLTETEGAAFWPVYEEYQEAMNQLRRRRMNLVLDFADASSKSAGQLSDDKAHELLASHLAIRRQMVAIEESYVPKFEAVLPEKKVARYYQIENKIDAIVNYELAAQIPLVQ